MTPAQEVESARKALVFLWVRATHHDYTKQENPEGQVTAVERLASVMDAGFARSVIDMFLAAERVTGWYSESDPLMVHALRMARQINAKVKEWETSGPWKQGM